MVQIQQRVLVGFLLLTAPLAARRFYDDDPIWREPAPVSVKKVQKKDFQEYLDFFRTTFFQPEKETLKPGRIPRSQGINTLGEVPDSAWYQNRRGLSLSDLVRGPNRDHAPCTDRSWNIVAAKNQGVSLGFAIEDGKGRTYFVKFDPLSNPEMATGADMIGARFFYDLGYNVPETYLIYFDRSQLTVSPKATIRDVQGRTRPMTGRDVNEILAKAPRDRENRYRGVASMKIPGRLLGPFFYFGTRDDDPNDLIPHQNRRDLRGLYVFAAWLNDTDAKAGNTMDSIVEEGRISFVRHYLFDFGAILGSDSSWAKRPAGGYEYMVDLKPALVRMATLGLYVPNWQRASYPNIPEVGRLGYETFDPGNWKNNYPNPAFERRLPGDTYWAAKKVMAFTDEQIRAIVETGEFSDPRAADWITRCLIERRDRIGRAFFNDVLPLDNFHVRQNRLEFADLAVEYAFAEPRKYTVRWSRFDNEAERLTLLPGETTFRIPAVAGNYVAADIRGADERKSVTVYLRRRAARWDVVGIDRQS